MKKTIQTIVMAMLCLNFSVKAQSHTNNIKPLKIGDTIPEAIWNMPLQVVNHPESKKTITLNNYKGKLIILDFWATWCNVCLKSLNKLEGLQKQYKNELLVLPVTFQDHQMILPFVKNKKWELPSIVNDITLKCYFPHVSVPHQVWIKDGILLAITGHAYASEKNIEAVLNDNMVSFFMKEERRDLDYNKPLLVNGNGKEELLFHSMFTRFIKGAPATVTTFPFIYMANKPINFLYQKAFESEVSDYELNSRVKIELNDSLLSRVIIPFKIKSGDYENDKKLEQWMIDNTYCYDLRMPAGVTRTYLKDMMKADLNRFFGATLGIIGRMERRKVKALALIRTQKKDLVKTKGGRAINDIIDGTLHLKNKPLATFINLLLYANQHSSIPIIDATGYHDKINMEINASLNDIPKLKAALKKYGFDLYLGEYDVDLLVISSKKQIQ